MVDIWWYKTAPPAERYTKLKVIDYPRQGNPDRRCVMELAINDLQLGDLLWVGGEIEVTNNLPYAVEVAKKLTWETAAGGINGEVISPENGYNVSPQVSREWYPDGPLRTFHGNHHGLVPFCGSHVIHQCATVRYVSLVVYAGGSSLSGDDDWLDIEQGYGHMTVLQIRGGTWWQLKVLPIIRTIFRRQ